MRIIGFLLAMSSILVAGSSAAGFLVALSRATSMKVIRWKLFMYTETVSTTMLLVGLLLMRRTH